MSRKITDSFLFVLIAALIAGFAIKIFLIDIITITGDSMYPTLKNNEQVLAKKTAYGLNLPFHHELWKMWKKPKKNDIVLFHYENKMVVKRVAFTEGEQLEILEDSGYYYMVVGGEKISLTAEMYSFFCDNQIVPENAVFVLGDNPSESFDSRNYGFVSVNKMIGKIR